MRDIRVMRFGAFVAGIALYMQLAIVGAGALPATSAVTADALGEHALCLSGGGGIPAQPADSAPAAPTHDHTLFCCLWHSLSGVAPQTAPAAVPIAYAIVAPSDIGDAALIPGPPHGPANARAPPVPA
ncbi:MAG TPA: hypothetical protein VNV38_22430 [Stellaceae bacterium]|nr:hypothetical protein [Stellaceae bacterium]